MFLQWAIWLAYHQKNYEILPPPWIAITFLTLFYTYTNLHGCIKSYKSYENIKHLHRV